MREKVVGLHWFLHDLRLHDNTALKQLSTQCDEMLCLYVIDPTWFSARRWGFASMGQARQDFLSQSLSALDADLQTLGQQLVIKVGDPVAVITQLCQSLKVDVISYNRMVGVNERRAITQIAKQTTARHLMGESNTLLRFEDAQTLFSPFPETFSKFHRLVQKHRLPVADPLSTPECLPPPTNVKNEWQEDLRTALFEGGERAGKVQLFEFLWGSDHIQHYKETRNALDEAGSSSQFSPWLANGNLSVRVVAQAILGYQTERCQNESTEWLLYELWWREYFQWMSWCYDSRLFAFGGIQQKAPLTTYYADVFRAWQMGQTPYPLVNACMNQLRLTGWLSNRGRQIVASALVNECQLDWRWGAAWFEHALIDFDVASNYGNWQYLAGVGADPRGQRHFNLQKQTEYYDPSGEYRRKWLSQGDKQGDLDAS